MDREREAARAGWFLACAVLFVVSCFTAYTEAVYLLWGRDATASVTGTRIVPGTRGRTWLQVIYRFTEPDGTERRGYDRVGTTWTAPAGGLVAVRYTPGPDGWSRLAWNPKWYWVILFAASVIGILVCVGRILAEAWVETRPIERRGDRGRPQGWRPV